MFQHTTLLSKLLKDYNIANLPHGKKEDKRGDAFEDYTVSIISSSDLLKKAKSNSLDLSNSDDLAFFSIYERIKERCSNIISIKATREVEHRVTGGNPKTDIIIDIFTSSDTYSLPISVKQTAAEKVSMAEFDVNTIATEMELSDDVLISLLEKHQRDASAKYFSLDEKKDLLNRLSPIKVDFVRWVITGTKNISHNNDLRYPDLILKYQLDKTDHIVSINCFTPDEYIDLVMFTKNRKPRRGGFGTGLSWTYATRTKGKKIQFKG